MHLIREISLGLRRNPVRNILIFLTMCLGYSSVLITIATVEGGRSSIQNDLESLGLDCIACLNPVQVGWLRLGEKKGKRVDHEAGVVLRERLGADVRAVIPFKMELAGLTDLFRAKRSPTFMVTTHEFGGVLASGMLAGRFLDENDSIEMDPTPVAVDEALAREWNEDPKSLVGEVFTTRRAGKPLRVRVVGVLRDPISLRRQLESFDSQGMARSISSRRLEFKNIYLPMADEAPSGIIVQVKDVDAVERIADEVEAILAEMDMQPFLHVQKTWAEFLIDMVNRFSRLAHFFWIVNLLVVLLLNSTIATLAIEERYPEIAIRRVEGASLRQVLLPLVGEGVVLAIPALPLGLVLALVVQHTWIAPILHWEPKLDALAVIGTALTVLVLGAASNFVPARRVARLSPARVLANR